MDTDIIFHFFPVTSCLLDWTGLWIIAASFYSRKIYVLFCLVEGGVEDSVVEMWGGVGLFENDVAAGVFVVGLLKHEGEFHGG